VNAARPGVAPPSAAKSAIAIIAVRVHALGVRALRVGVGAVAVAIASSNTSRRRRRRRVVVVARASTRRVDIARAPITPRRATLARSGRGDARAELCERRARARPTAFDRV
jgi:hypothetical protein